MGVLSIFIQALIVVPSPWQGSKSQAASEDFPLWTFHVQLLLLIVPCQPGFDKNFGKLPEANEVTEIGVDRRGKSCYHNLALISRSGGIGRRPGLKIPWE